MKFGAVLAIIVAIVGVGMTLYAFLSSASPYVSAKEAAANPGKRVHVAGEIDHSSVKMSLGMGAFEFDLIDDHGDRLRVRYGKAKPGNFDMAPKASVSGEFRDGMFLADDLKTQCPSKYEAAK
ncbi:MAG: cytochrome c maturation protein CcmE [Armatimonadota bacterium]